MNQNSRAWDWTKADDEFWRVPAPESYYLLQRWKGLGLERFLDFGCGLGRHSLFFAENGFDVTAFDLSKDGVERLREEALKRNLDVEVSVQDMHDLPYDDNSFDCILAYLVISHTDSNGVVKIIEGIRRILRPGGEVYLTLCSKDTWSFRDAGFPRLDENTVIRTDEGPEFGVPHFFVSLDDAMRLLEGFDIISIRHINDCFFQGRVRNSCHYFVHASRP